MQSSKVFRGFLLLSLAGLAVTFAGLAAAQTNTKEQVTVGNRVLLRDGNVWVPKGITFVGLLGATASNTHKPRPAYTVAWRRWGSAEIEAALRFGADTIRLQVSQPALDKESGHYDRSYLAKVKAAVRLIRAAHMNVILSMQWQVTTGVDKQINVPTDATVTAPLSSTVRAWRTLAPPFLSDRGVIFELFNEPCVKVNQADAWQRWGAGYQFVIDAVRRMGATNALLIDGIQCGKVLADAPRLYDSGHALAYATHPYPMPEGVKASSVDMFTARDFERNFGQFQKEGHAIIATEWNVWKNNCHDGRDGHPATPQIALNLLHFLKTHKIGLIIWPMEFPHFVWTDRDWTSLTSLQNFRGCHLGKGTNMGAGATVSHYFKTGEVVLR